MSTADCVSSPCFFCFKQVPKIVFGTRRIESLLLRYTLFFSRIFC